MLLNELKREHEGSYFDLHATVIGDSPLPRFLVKEVLTNEEGVTTGVELISGMKDIVSMDSTSVGWFRTITIVLSNDQLIMKAESEIQDILVKLEEATLLRANEMTVDRDGQFGGTYIVTLWHEGED